ncbi:hypothetical protein [Xanthomonas cerealis]|uniref:hypothetical protein n=1 Tax=Xanthomonas cerealis TaxID=3390025 RepID=UPI0012699C07|nr:hypothetical protein [Xanthomonas translucens]UKE45591.1 hypothetical protein KHA79_10255 [Xanthomonas translucens pv. cerealis]
MTFVTGHAILLVAIATVSLGVARLVVWFRAQRLRRLDAEYRASLMAQEAERVRWDRFLARQHEVFYDPYD